MNRTIRLFLLLGLAIAATNLVEAAPPRFAAEIAAFEASDKTNPPPRNAILFTGASSIRKWKTLARDFPDHKVINRGFGGSQIIDAIYYFDRIVTPYHPKMIVFYSGGNDINSGKTPEMVVDDFKTFVQKVETTLPDTKVAFISINASPVRWKDVEKVKQANRAIAAFMAKSDRRMFIDTYSAMLDANGRPRPELYLQDRLHPNAKGYAIWTSVIAPYLNR
jgi:lysophospholipase L1-like esterase